MKKILTVVGARPQIIKASAISRAIEEHYKDQLQEVIVHTGQHYDQQMSDVFFQELRIPKPDFNLGVGSGSHGKQTGKMIEGLEEVILKVAPDCVLVYGDTNSTLAASVAASKIHVPIVHVEAGLRSFNRRMPEEVNRVVCDHLSTLLFSPTKKGYDQLIKEGFEKQEGPYTAEHPGVFHCGDVMFDNSLFFSELAKSDSTVLEENQLEANRYILATIHRDHNTDDPDSLESIFRAIAEIGKEIPVLLPIHPRTKLRISEHPNPNLKTLIESSKGIKIIEPVSFLDMIQLERNSKMIITDSGGVQKESYFFAKPCVILRPQTEWTEVLDTGLAKLADADYDKIMEAFSSLIKLQGKEFPVIFGDGNAGKFICERIINDLA